MTMNTDGKGDWKYVPEDDYPPLGAPEEKILPSFGSTYTSDKPVAEVLKELGYESPEQLKKLREAEDNIVPEKFKKINRLTQAEVRKAVRDLRENYLQKTKAVEDTMINFQMDPRAVEVVNDQITIVEQLSDMIRVTMERDYRQEIDAMAGLIRRLEKSNEELGLALHKCMNPEVKGWD